MRKFLTALFLFTAFSLFAQEKKPKTFTFYDGVLDTGSVMRRYDIYFDLAKATLRPEDSIVLDSIAGWLILRPELAIEIGQHSDYENPNASSRLTDARAKAVMMQLIASGVPAGKLTAKGYGDKRNLISQSAIAKETLKTKKDSLQRINRRTEFKITGVNLRLVKTFLLSDTVFQTGEVYRTHRFNFDYEDTMIHDDNLPELDSVAAFLIAHPQLSVEIGQHTTLAGSDEYDFKESANMTIAIRDYFIAKGISPGRMTTKGYGKTRPLYPEEEINKTLEERKRQFLHYQNYRTEFKIISVN